jgi:hypothetical protein
MFMIILGLFQNLFFVLFYFQYDRLWKSVQIAATVARSHDVHDEKGVSPKLTKHAPLFSITYGQQSEATLARLSAEPTISMTEKDFLANGHFVANLYAIENRTRSYLAQQRNGIEPTMSLKENSLARQGAPPDLHSPRSV